MSHFLDRLSYFSAPKESFSDDHGTVHRRRPYLGGRLPQSLGRTTRSFARHTASIARVRVRGGFTSRAASSPGKPSRPTTPAPVGTCPTNRAAARAARAIAGTQSANRVKYPMVRGRLLKSWRAARLAYQPVEAWASIVESEAKRRDYQSVRGLGGSVRSSWDEVNEIIAAANVYTIKKHGPDRVIGFSPIPAMSMVSYAAAAAI